MNNELKEKIEKMESELAQMKEQLKEKKDEGFKVGDEYYCIGGGGGNITQYDWTNHPFDNNALAQGNIFKTEQEALKEARRRELCVTLKRIIEEKNDGWKPDWGGNNQRKYFLFVDYEDDCIGINWWCQAQYIHNDYHIKDYETAKEIRKENKELLEELKGLGWI